jgi:integral membrane sensor domain MASE1
MVRMIIRLPDSSGRLLFQGSILAGSYFVCGKLGLMLAFVHPNASAVWPPAGIALASFLLLGNRVWPWIFLGAFMVNVTTAGSIATSLAIAFGNTAEGFIGSYLVRRFAGGLNAFDSATGTIRFVFLSAFLSTTFSATVGVTSLSVAGFANWSDYRSIWTTWWLGDAMGVIIAGSLILLWKMKRQWVWDFWRVVEGVALMFALVFLGQAVFGGWVSFGVKNYPLEILNVAVIVWAAVRFDQREIATGMFILSVIAIWGTMNGYGPFAWGSPGDALLSLQVFMGFTATIGLVASAVVSRQRRLSEHLQESLDHLRTLKGLLPICAWCKKIRNDLGYWEEVEFYISEHSDATFTHGICPTCVARHNEELQARKAR